MCVFVCGCAYESGCPWIQEKIEPSNVSASTQTQVLCNKYLFLTDSIGQPWKTGLFSKQTYVHIEKNWNWIPTSYYVEDKWHASRGLQEQCKSLNTRGAECLVPQRSEKTSEMSYGEHTEPSATFATLNFCIKPSNVFVPISPFHYFINSGILVEMEILEWKSPMQSGRYMSRKTLTFCSLLKETYLEHWERESWGKEVGGSEWS